MIDSRIAWKDTLEENIKRVVQNSKELQYFLRFYETYFHDYSFHNTLLIYAQNREARYVAGFHTWKKLGYKIKKGSKGITIFAPRTKKEETEGEKKLIGFFPIKVFADTQVEATETAIALPHVDTDLENTSQCHYPISSLYEVTKRSIEEKIQSKIQEYTPVGAEKGKTDGKEIYISKRKKAGMLGTLIHEYVHYCFHFQKETTYFRNQQEVEAELGAMIFGSLFHLEIEKKYIYLYSFQENVDFTGAFSKVFPLVHSLAQEVSKKLGNRKKDKKCKEIWEGSKEIEKICQNMA